MDEVVTNTMRYTFEYNTKEKFLEVHATGTMDDKAFPEVARMFWGKLSENDCWKSLIDYRSFSFTKSTFQIYMRPQIVIDIGGTNRVKMAVLVESIDDVYRFLETVYYNRGVQIKMFTNSEEAIQWLDYTSNRVAGFLFKPECLL